VTTNMDGRDVLPRLSRPFAFSTAIFSDPNPFQTSTLLFTVHAL